MAILEAEAIAVDPVHVFIICPHCAKVHLHGSIGDINKTKYGSRAPHCGHSGDYDIICSKATVRCKDRIGGSKAAMKLYRRRV